MAAKIILVTHAPTKGGKPLDGASGRRLAALAGLDQADAAPVVVPRLHVLPREEVVVCGSGQVGGEGE